MGKFQSCKIELYFIIGEVGEDEEEKECIGAVPSRQYGLKHGVVKDVNMERSEVIERNTVVLSRRQLYGVVPNVSRKRKVSDAQEIEKKTEKERG